MTLCSTIQKVRSYTLKVESVDGKFEMTTKVNKVDKGVLLPGEDGNAVENVDLT